MGRRRSKSERRQRPQVRFGMPWFILFTDRKLTMNEENRVKIRLSGTLIFWCLLPLLMAGPLWLVLVYATWQQPNWMGVVLILGVTPFVIIGLAGPGLTWRSDFDKDAGVLTIWNWLQRHQFPLEHVQALFIDGQPATRGERRGIDRETADSPGISPNSSRSGGHGTLFHVYLTLDDGEDRFRIHIATVESHQDLAGQLADAIRRVCELKR